MHFTVPRQHTTEQKHTPHRAHRVRKKHTLQHQYEHQQTYIPPQRAIKHLHKKKRVVPKESLYGRLSIFHISTRAFKTWGKVFSYYLDTGTVRHTARVTGRSDATITKTLNLMARLFYRKTSTAYLVQPPCVHTHQQHTLVMRDTVSLIHIRSTVQPGNRSEGSRNYIQTTHHSRNMRVLFYGITLVLLGTFIRLI